MFKLTVLLIAATLLLNVSAWSQKKFSLSAFAGSGFSFFGGPGAVSSSNYYRNGLAFPNEVDTMAQPYGKKPFPNFLAGIQADVTLSKWILSISSQYENTGGSLTGDSIITPSGSIKANGKYTRNYDFISINPQVGRIIVQKTITFALHTGIDYTSKLAMGNQFDYTDQNGIKNSVGYSGGEPEINDVRITVGVSAAIKKWSIFINYKHGLANYNPSGENVYSRLLQIRIQYTFLSKLI